jgi:ABC-type bacteriocin/lantibiotic exporter with double-glycine peptidase domain
VVEPDVIDPRPQLGSSDCAVRALSWLLGLSYETVLAAIPKRVNVKSNGLTELQIVRAATRLGCVVRAVEGLPDDDDLVVLDLFRKNGRKYEGHVVLQLRGGNVLDPGSGLIFRDVETYGAEHGWTVQGYFVRET